MDSLLEAIVDPSMSKLHGGGGEGGKILHFEELLRQCPNDHPR